jgi:hypothetical protein
MYPIVDSARAGHVRLFWSPCIIEEASRLQAWLWLKRRAGDVSEASRRGLSDLAKRWFRIMTTVFEVVDDKPPPAPLWTETPRDDDDLPIWTAAVRAKADVIVTENLDDGPPPDEDGLRHYQGIWYVHPDDFVALLDWWGHLYETGQSRTYHEREESSTVDAAPPQGADEEDLTPASISAFIEALIRRAREQLPTSGEPA